MVLNGVKKNTELGENSKYLWVGRGKDKRFFSPLGFLRGAEGVQKFGAERPRKRTGEAVRSGSLGVEYF